MIRTAQPSKPLVVVSSVSDDAVWLKAFRPHLELLGEYGDVRIWDKTDIQAGDDRYRELDEHMKSARIVICLISVDYLNAIRDFESFGYLLEQRQRGGLLLVPILVRHCAWKLVPWLERIQMFPLDNQPVAAHDKNGIEELFTEVVLDLHKRLKTPESVADIPRTEEKVAVAARQILAEDAVIVPPLEVELPEGLREDIQHLPETGHKLFGRTRELALLDAAWASGETNVISLIAWGGVGKSTLVNRWLERMRADGYGGARRVYAWSFYSQGTKQQVTSSDLFFDETLRWFGAEGFEQQSIWDKAELLAGLIREEETLLVLDGVEPLQSGDEFDRGVFRDGGLQCLLQELIRDNSGLCVVTSRVPLTDYKDDITIVAAESLAIKDDGTIDKYPDRPAVQVNLETISPEAGRDLLKTEFVQGTNAELEQATREFGCHALAVSLLGSWLHEIPGHHISQRDQIPDLDVPEEEGKHARRVLAAFEDLLGESAELELLRIMGLFDRPASTALVEAVLNGETIDGLTSHYREDVRTALASSLAKLRHLRLLASASEHRPDDIDCHPLIREHFAAQLDERLPEAAREAHRRLYEHLKQSALELPDNLIDMMPLYHAVAHGCKAGSHEDALHDVYRTRIQRGSEYFNTKKLGALGGELSTVSNFFKKPFFELRSGFSLRWQSYLLNEAGYDLRAMGRTLDAGQSIAAGVAVDVEGEDWVNGAIDSSNLSGLWLTLGDVPSAVAQGERSVELADRSDDAFHRASKRATLAAALQASGRGLEGCRTHEAALAAFREAEAIWQRDTDRAFLWSTNGFDFCGLLLDKAVTLEECRAIRIRSKTTLDWVLEQAQDLLSPALDHLTLARTYLLEARLIQNTGVESQEAQKYSALLSAIDSAEHHLNDSVSLLRQAGTQNHLPRGLLHRAALWRVKYEITDDVSQIKLAERDLAEAERNAERGSMLIWQIEAALERTRLALVLGDKKQAKEKLDKACELIRQTEKPYVPHKPDWADWDPPDYIGVFAEGDIVGYHRRNREIEALRQAIDQ